MKHARADYNRRIQDAAENDPSLLAEGTRIIPKDEPVFLLRATDAIAPGVVREWANRLQRHARSTDDPMAYRPAIQAAMRQARAMEEWQAVNGSKLPDTPAEEVEA